MWMDPPLRGGSRADLVLTGPHGVKISYALKFGFEASNNEVKYEALIARIRLAKDIGAEKLEVFSDSMLVVQQLNGPYEAKGEWDDLVLVACTGNDQRIPLMEYQQDT